MKKSIQKNSKEFFVILLLLVALNGFGSFVYKRFDLTSDKRYTLSKITLDVLDNVDEEVVVDVFLEGQFPQEFRRLQAETRQLLEEYQAYNSNIKFQFINPLDKEGGDEETLKMLFDFGLKPINITVTDKGKQSQEVVFPWAIASSGNKAAKVQLLKNLMGANTEEKVISSVQHLEYVVTEAIHKISNEKTKKIAVLKGNGELEDIYIADFLKSLRDSYHIAPFTLDSVANNPVGTLEGLNQFDLAIIAKPTQTFTEEQIQVLDQFVMNGGKTLWMLDQVQADFDSLQATGAMPVFAKDQSLGELLFKYGIRINPVLVKDEVATPIKLAVGKQGSETQYQEFLWKFAPFVYPESNHPIVKNIEGVRFDFASPIDTLKNELKKTVLLQSSRYSTLFGTPAELNLSILNEQVSEADYDGKGSYTLAVLLEGNFKSVYQNRVLPFKLPEAKMNSSSNKMIVISDGDLLRNQLDQNLQPLELGYDKWTNKLYGNKEFLTNAVQYLLDDTGLITLRTKEVSLPVLDKQKVYADYRLIQIISVGIPILLIVLFGLFFTYMRKLKFAKK